MKQITAILLVFAFLYSSTLYFAGFHISRFYNQMQNKAGASVLKISKSEHYKLKWIEQGKEFIFNNQMYDVIKSEENNSYITYFVYADSSDYKLISHLLIKFDKSKQNHKKKQNIQQKRNYFANKINLNFNIYGTYIIYSFFNENYFVRYLQTESPPPRQTIC